MIPGLGRSTGERIGYPLQYSWASFVVQLVKNPPAVWETWDRSLGWKDPLEKRKGTHSSILAWRIPWTVEGKGYPFQYSWASLVAQLVKNLPAVWETWVESLGWEDPLEKGKATHSSILAWRIPKCRRVGHD